MSEINLSTLLKSIEKELEGGATLSMYPLIRCGRAFYLPVLLDQKKSECRLRVRAYGLPSYIKGGLEMLMSVMLDDCNRLNSVPGFSTNEASDYASSQFKLGLFGYRTCEKEKQELFISVPVEKVLDTRILNYDPRSQTLVNYLLDTVVPSASGLRSFEAEKSKVYFLELTQELGREGGRVVGLGGVLKSEFFYDAQDYELVQYVLEQCH